jgi:hypothetical protein
VGLGGQYPIVAAVGFGFLEWLIRRQRS